MNEAKLRKISMIVNDKPYTFEIDIRDSLLEVLRNRLQLTGVKQGCSVGECGVCTIIIDGTTVNSCTYLAIWADGKKITTIEGVSKDGKLSKVQQAFIDEGAIQCGFCTPGLVLTTTALVENSKKIGKKYTKEEIKKEIKKEISGHLCRCTGYQKIYKAVVRSLEE